MRDQPSPVSNTKLRYERERHNWTQQELAEKLGTTRLNVGRWERGATQPGHYFRQRLCEIFGKSPEELGLLPDRAERAGPAALSRDWQTWVTAQAEPGSPIWNVPYRRNLFFTGREDVLTHIHSTFTTTDNAIALTQSQAISGLGGIGKTQVAIEYAHRYRKCYDNIFWVRADTHDLLVSDYLRIAALLNFPQHHEKDQSLIVNSVKRWFDAQENWLLIFDNADHPQMIEPFLPSTGSGHILITTRAHSTGTVAQRVELDKMSLEEGALFLLRRTKQIRGNTGLEKVASPIRKAAEAIVAAVDGLPLALDQAAAYIEETGYSLTDYLKLYKTRSHHLLHKRGDPSSDHPESVVTTWSLAFERVGRANALSTELLRLCAFLHPDAIPEAMIMEGATELGNVLCSIAENELVLNEAVGELRRYSLVRRHAESSTLTLHRLIQQIVRAGLDQATQRIWAERVICMLNKVFPQVEVATWSACQELIAHIETGASLIKHYRLYSPLSAELLTHAGYYLYQRVQYEEATRLFQQALTIYEQIYGSEHAEIARIFHYLGLLYTDTGKYDLAEQYFTRALTLRESLFGPDHALIAETFNGIGLLYWQMSRYTEAEALYAKVVAIGEKALGAAHIQMAEYLNNQALIYHYMHTPEYYARAESLYCRALAIWEQHGGYTDLAPVICKNNLGILYYWQEKYVEAEATLKFALACYDRLIGRDNTDAALTIFNLGLTCKGTGRYQDAEHHFKEAMAIWERHLGPYHPRVLIGINGLGFSYLEQKRYNEAETCFRRVLALHKKISNMDTYEKAGGYRGLAEVYLAQKKYLHALEMSEKMIEIYKQMFGANHSRMARPFYIQACILCQLERYDEAEDLLRRILALQKELWGSQRLLIADALEQYAILLRTTMREAEAQVCEQDARSIRFSLQS